MFCAQAANWGAVVNGIDAAPLMIAIDREHTRHGDFRVGEMENLLYADKSFDPVTGFNSFQYAADHLDAMQEDGRVAWTGAQVVAATWGKPQDCQAAAYVAAMGSLMPSPAPGDGILLRRLKMAHSPRC